MFSGLYKIQQTNFKIYELGHRQLLFKNPNIEGKLYARVTAAPSLNFHIYILHFLNLLV